MVEITDISMGYRWAIWIGMILTCILLVVFFAASYNNGIILIFGFVGIIWLLIYLAWWLDLSD